jgi:hypothetical protein
VLVERRAQALAEWKRMAFAEAVVALHRHVDRLAFVRLQLERVGCHAAGEPLRRRLKLDHRPQPIAIEALVIQRNLGVAVGFRGRGAAAFAA